MAYKIEVKKQAIKELNKIPNPYYSKIIEAIVALQTNPFPQGYKNLKGRDGGRIRVANYRIIYTVSEETVTITIVAIGHRKDIY